MRKWFAGISAAVLAVSACTNDVTSPSGTRPDLLIRPGGDNQPPTVEIVSPTDGQLFAFNSAAGATVNLTANIADPNTTDTHTCSIDWDGVTSDGTVSEADGSGTCTGSNLYTTPGVYSIVVTATDQAGASGADTVMIVVYNPNGGFVTGGGWINTPAGAYSPDPTLTGKTTFGLVAKYKKGASVPDGNTEFQFHAAGMNFHATAYDWLVVAGRKAQYTGTGTINGSGSYRFMMTLIDGDLNGGDKIDRLRMKIWDDNGVLYDNQVGGADDADPTTALANGSIVIHK